MKKNKKKIIAIITVLLIILVAVFVYSNITIEKNVDEYQDYTPQEEISEDQMRQTKVILYFANSETGELESEAKVIDANLLINEPCKEIIKLLMKGPQSSNLKKLIPEGTALHDVKIEKSCAIINMSSEFLNYENDENKLKIINSIVNTLTNLKEISSIKILINGEENENLSEIYLRNS